MPKSNAARIPLAFPVPTCKGCGFQAIPDGEPDPVFCPRCDSDEWKQAEECTCPNHIISPSDMCARHQAEFIAHLDEQAELDAIQQMYETEIAERG